MKAHGNHEQAWMHEIQPSDDRVIPLWTPCGRATAPDAQPAAGSAE